jgi:metallophosphoesterase (TIGR00282 family)
MRLCYLGDVIGRAGREAVHDLVPQLKRSHGVDFAVVCAENAAHGFGLTARTADEFFAYGADVLTLGNHAWDQREMLSHIDKDPRILRPLNYPPGTPGRGAGIFDAADGRRVAVVQVMGRLFMDPLDDPFAAAASALEQIALGAGRQRPGGQVHAAIVDIHAEATSEKMAMGHFCDGRASLVAGTHSHIPTADAQVLPGGTAYITDLGMCGDYDSVIGMRKEAAIARFTRKVPGERLGPAGGKATVCGVIVDTDDASGLAVAVTPLRVGGRLEQTVLPPRPTA